MALYKSIKQNDGVTTSYHRILFIQQMINHHNSIAVVSYVDAETRELTQPYQKSTTYELGYDPYMTIESAYGYLKTLPQFEGAEDI